MDICLQLYVVVVKQHDVSDIRTKLSKCSNENKNKCKQHDVSDIRTKLSKCSNENKNKCNGANKRLGCVGI
jgi:hypothetical protein